MLHLTLYLTTFYTLLSSRGRYISVMFIQSYVDAEMAFLYYMRSLNYLLQQYVQAVFPVTMYHQVMGYANNKSNDECMPKSSICFIIQQHLDPFCFHPSLN